MHEWAKRFRLPVCVGATSATLSVLYLGKLGGPGLAAITCWLAVAVFASAMANYAFKASRLMDRSDPARRFWTAYALASLCFAVGEWAQVTGTVAAPTSSSALTGTGTARTVALGVGGTVLVAVILSYRLPRGTIRERLCYQLDLATVIVAASCFGVFWTISGTTGVAQSLAGVAAGPVVALCAGFAVGRLYLSGAAPFRWHIGLVGPVAAAIEAIARALGPGMVDAGQQNLIFLLTLWSHALLLVATWLQHQRSLHRYERRAVTRKRPYSLLPYAALGITYTLLVETLVANGLDPRAWIVLAGAVSSTAIVVARQLYAFADNAQLLAERNALAERLHAMAFTDSLTGLANRALFLDRLDQALQERHAGPTGVLLIDLDDFKPVNDRYGHAAGDAVLQQTAVRLRRALGPSDVIARLGGDEFAVIVRAPLAERLSAVAEKVARDIAEPCTVAGGISVTVGASVGTAVSDGIAVDSAALLRRADEAMYKVKIREKAAGSLQSA